jgi:hypothetical protein
MVALGRGLWVSGSKRWLDWDAEEPKSSSGSFGVSLQRFVSHCSLLMFAFADSCSFTPGFLGTGVATTLGALANATLVEPRSIAATASSSCNPSCAASVFKALLSFAVLGSRISKCGCETLFLMSFLRFLGFEAVSRAEVLRPKMLKFDFCLELSVRPGPRLGDVVVVGDGEDLSSGSSYSASADDGFTLCEPVVVIRGQGPEMLPTDALARGRGSTLVGEVVETGEVVDL